MWRSCVLLGIVGLSSCAYVTRSEFIELWDEDGDGWPVGEDCAPLDSGIFPGAADPRGDGCDTDCGREPDADNDDWPDAADCGPDDPDIHPCSVFEATGDGIDHDCDGLDTARVDSCPGIDPDYPDALPRSCGEDP